MSYIITAPLVIVLSKKNKFSINLNQYRNAHYQTLNRAKVIYKETIADQLIMLPEFTKIVLDIWLYPSSNRVHDLDNSLSIQCKFFLDALVEAKRIPDDNYKYVPQIHLHFGEIDKENPRAEIEITEVII